MTDGDAILRAANVSKRYATRGEDLLVLRDVSLEVAGGESLAIMGPSGCGKSTLLNVIGTLEPPSDGTVKIAGVDPYSLAERQLAEFRNLRVGFVFQAHHLLPQCSVLENVLLPTLADGGGENREPRARELLERVGLAERLDHLPGELSGGERQRTALARALINAPALVLADEPTGNLDRRSAGEVADLLTELYRDQGAALVVVTHSERLAERFGRLLRLDDGTLASG